MEVSENLKKMVLDGIKDEIDGIKYWQGLSSLLKSEGADLTMAEAPFDPEKALEEAEDDERKHLNYLRNFSDMLFGTPFPEQGGNTAEGSMPSWATRLGL